MATNPISDVTFGQERTARQMRDRAQWERDQAARLRAEMRDRPASEVMVGQEHVAQAHEDTARAYEQAARKREHEESGVQPKRLHAATKKTASSAPSTFTIVRMRGNEVSFWTGRRWTNEFPDAGEADSLPLAYAAFASAQDRSFTEGDEISIVENYGLDSERTVRHLVKGSRSHATKKTSKNFKLHKGYGGEWWIWRTTMDGDIVDTIGPFRTRESAEAARVNFLNLLLQDTSTKRAHATKKTKKSAVGKRTHATVKGKTGLKASEYTKLATATSVPRIEKYINEYAYSTDYRVDPETLQITNPIKAPPENWFVMPYRGGYLFGRKL